VRAALGLALALAGAAGCTQKLTQPAVVAPPRDFVLITPPAVQSIFDARCPKCHTGTAPLAGLYLSPGNLSYSELVNKPSLEDSSYLLVEPGNVLDSYLMMKLRWDSRMQESGMPLGDPPLPQASQEIISDWIALGARPDTLFLPALVARAR
jgi:hypothetical protein